jgi:isochorismate pyruvate lyase
MNKLPEDCQSLAEIRQEIDRIDREIISQLSQRYHYVQAASKFKTNETSVKAPDRLKLMLQARREWAETEGLNPDVIEKMYRDLVAYFIQEELQHWSSNS